MGGIGARVNSPREVLSSQLTRSPWKTGNWTVCWLSGCQHTCKCRKGGESNLSATVVNVRFLTRGS
jgi:hypothetical protein